VGERDKASRDLELLNSDPMSIWVTRHSRMSGGRDGSPVGAIEHKSGADVEQHDGVPGAEIVLGLGVANWGEGVMADGWGNHDVSRVVSAGGGNHFLVGLMRTSSNYHLLGGIVFCFLKCLDAN
jgi:hypothetical protein